MTLKYCIFKCMYQNEVFLILDKEKDILKWLWAVLSLGVGVGDVPVGG